MVVVPTLPAPTTTEYQLGSPPSPGGAPPRRSSNALENNQIVASLSVTERQNHGRKPNRRSAQRIAGGRGRDYAYAMGDSPPGQDYAFYARPENQVPQGTPVRRRRTMPVPVSVHLPPELLERVRKAAQAYDRTLSEWVRQAVEHELRGS
jgi:hypothetical protein